MKALRVLFPLALALSAVAAEAQSLLRAPQFDLPPGDYYQDLADLNLDGTIDGLVRSQGGWRVVFNVGVNPIDGAAVSTQPGDGRSALGDVTGDGFADFALSYNLTSQGLGSGVQLLRGNGDGTFAAPVLLAGPGSVWGLELADINGDGVDDVVTLDWKATGSPGAPYEVNVWFLNGSAPQAAQPMGLPVPIEDMAALDLNGDGSQEVAVARSGFAPGTTDVFVIRWDSSGSPSLVQSLDITTEFGSLSGLQAGDIDGDGDVDLFASLQAFPNGQAMVLKNIAGVLTPGPLQVGLGQGQFSDPLPLVDWDGDGDADALQLDDKVGSISSYELSFLESKTTGMQFSASLRLPYEPGFFGMAGIVDLNADGFLDVVSGRVVYFGRGKFDSGLAQYIASGCCIIGGFAEDLDRDGDLDLWSVDRQAWFNDATGKGPKMLQFEIALPGIEALESIFSRGDFDGDGYADYLMEWGDLKIVPPGFPLFTFKGTRLVRGLADGSFVDGGIASLGRKVGPGLSVGKNTGDMDGDGDLDVLAEHGWHVNNGNGTFGSFVPAYSDIPRGAFDFDGDGDLDLVFRDGSSFVSSWRIEVNDGTGHFTTGPLFGVPGQVASEPLWFDFDGDGLLDLCSGVKGSSLLSGVAVARNLGAGSFSPMQAGLSSAIGYDHVAAGDVDGDGVSDLVGWLSSMPGSMVQVDVWLGSAGTPGSYGVTSYWVKTPNLVMDMDGDGDDDLVSSGVIEATTHDGPSAGSIKQYGFGFAGGKTSPLLGAAGPLVPGSPTAELRISHGVGGASYFVFGGASEIRLLGVPVPRSAVFISSASLIDSGVLRGRLGSLGGGGVALNKTPWTLAFPGLTMSFQAVLLHPSYPGGLALTNAVTLEFGF